MRYIYFNTAAKHMAVASRARVWGRDKNIPLAVCIWI